MSALILVLVPLLWFGLLIAAFAGALPGATAPTPWDFGH